MVFLSKKKIKKESKKRKRKKNKTERVYLNPNCHKTLNFFFLRFSSSPLLCWNDSHKKKSERDTKHTSYRINNTQKKKKKKNTQ